MRDSSKPLLDPGIWIEEETALLEASARIYGKVERLPCLAAIGIGKPCDEVRWLIALH